MRLKDLPTDRHQVRFFRALIHLAAFFKEHAQQTPQVIHSVIDHKSCFTWRKVFSFSREDGPDLVPRVFLTGVGKHC
jgi:hypothetical protein